MDAAVKQQILNGVYQGDIGTGMGIFCFGTVNAITGVSEFWRVFANTEDEALGFIKGYFVNYNIRYRKLDITSYRIYIADNTDLAGYLFF